MSRSETCNGAFLQVLAEIEQSGRTSAAAPNTTSERATRKTRELIAHLHHIDRPRDRIVANNIRTVDLPVAVARFVWMMSASDRLADIAFYEPRVKGFTDDGVSVPGSSYGRRIRQSYPGIDQLAGAIHRLREDGSGTRRAAISIYQPTDTTRDSNDIPCAFGLIYHGREGALHSTTIMRSNNAIGLLPFNLFEFSLLAEVVAVEANLDLGPMNHFAGSMHYFEDDFANLPPLADATSAAAVTMPAMPSSPSPLDEIRKLILLEAEMRQGSERVRAPFVDEWRQRVQAQLSPYWQQFAFLLLLQIAKRANDAGAHEAFRQLLDSVYRAVVPEFRGDPKTSSPNISAAEQLFKPGQPALDISGAGREALNERVVFLCKAYEARSGHALGAAVAIGIHAEFSERLAARKTDNELVSEDEFNAVLDRHLQVQGLASIATTVTNEPSPRPRRKPRRS